MFTLNQQISLLRNDLTELKINLTDNIEYDISNLDNKIYSISGSLDVVTNEVVSISGSLDVVTNEVVSISGSLDVLNNEVVSISGSLDTLTSNVEELKTTKQDTITNESDISLNNLHVLGDLIVDGLFNINNMIINNEILISTQLDISNEGTGPALKVTQLGSGPNKHVAIFNAGEEGDSLLIDSSGNTTIYKNLEVIGDVSMNNVRIQTLDVSNLNIEDNELSISNISSLQNILDNKQDEITTTTDLSLNRVITNNLLVNGNPIFDTIVIRRENEEITPPINLVELQTWVNNINIMYDNSLNGYFANWSNNDINVGELSGSVVANMYNNDLNEVGSQNNGNSNAMIIKNIPPTSINDIQSLVLYNSGTSNHIIGLVIELYNSTDDLALTNILAKTNIINDVAIVYRFDFPSFSSYYSDFASENSISLIVGEMHPNIITQEAITSGINLNGNVYISQSLYLDNINVNDFLTYTSNSLNVLLNNTTDLSSNVNEINSNITDLSSNVNDLSSNVNEINTNLTDLSSNVNEINTNLTDLSSNVNEINSNLTDLFSNVNDLSSNVNDLSSNVNEINTNLTDLSSNVNDLSSNVNDLFSNVNDLSSNVNDLSSNVNDLSISLTDLSSNVTDLSNSLNDSVSILQRDKQDTITNESDISLNTLYVFGDFTVDGSFNINNMIQNNTTINNEILISTQLDISNEGTGPALKVTQLGSGLDKHVAIFNAGEEGDSLLIDSSGNTTIYKKLEGIGDVSLNNVRIQTLDVSNLNIDDNELSISKINGLSTALNGKQDEITTTTDLSFGNIESDHCILNTIDISDITGSGLQPLLTAGDNISIVGNIISATGTTLPANANFSSVTTDVLNASTINASNIVGYQETLIAGDNISIVGNTISASGGGGGSSPVAFQAFSTASKTITTVLETLPFDGLVVDTNNAYDTATYTYTIPITGTYSFYCQFLKLGVNAYSAEFSNITTGTFLARFQQNGDDGTTEFINGTIMAVLNQGDQIRMRCTGGTVRVISSNINLLRSSWGAFLIK